MKNRYLSTRIMAIMMAAAMAVSAAPAAFAAVPHRHGAWPKKWPAKY